MNSQQKLYKYPRTYHAPWSLGCTSDDKKHTSMEQFKNKRVIVTEKLDGENTTLAPTKHYARSLDSVNNGTRSWVSRLHSNISFLLPEDYRICGENVFCKHSIFYDNLETYFYGFSMWKDTSCLSWDETLEWFSLLNITPVPVLYDGIYDENLIKGLWPIATHEAEGYVIRLADSFEYDTFKLNVAKFVRPNHVTTDQHWSHQKIIPNKLKF
jgi:hypothetical protein